MIYLIYGPPGAGKTTHAEKYMSGGDIIIDWDLISHALTRAPIHEREEILFDRVMDCHRWLTNTIDQYPEVRNTWVVACAPKIEDRNAIRYSPNLEMKLILEDAATCKARCSTRVGWIRWEKAIDRWFDEYEPEEEKCE